MTGRRAKSITIVLEDDQQIVLDLVNLTTAVTGGSDRKRFRMQCRPASDEPWTDCDIGWDDVIDALNYAKEASRDGIRYGMTRVIEVVYNGNYQDSTIVCVATFAAGRKV